MAKKEETKGKLTIFYSYEEETDVITVTVSCSEFFDRECIDFDEGRGEIKLVFYSPDDAEFFSAFLKRCIKKGNNSPITHAVFEGKTEDY